MPARSDQESHAPEGPSFDSSHLRLFAEGYDFPLDPFQQKGCAAVLAGRGVLVAAPTGAGKTVVGEFAAYLAVHTGTKAFYTTPIKALSNQKYADFVARYGADQVGLLTGDQSVNGEAPVVVMTTEVLRNMLYAGSDTLRGLRFVVMDEVHYLADRFRGAVWEEVIIQLASDVQVVSLSATVSNAEEFGDWLREVRGHTDVVVEEHRPVPLWEHMMVGRQIIDLFEPDTTDHELNRALLQRIAQFDGQSDRYGRREDAGAPRGRRGRQVRGRTTQGPVRGGRPSRGPSRADVIDELDRDGLLPAITFIFSRAGCDSAVAQLLAWGTRLIPEQEGERLRRIVEKRVSSLPDEDLTVLGYWDFVEAITRGFAAHHAGMLPTFREIVEELFTAGSIQAVFATETLALGINMPARTVVLERLVKYNGEAHVDITPAEFTQLTGRAGRRGIDVEGHAVVLYGRGVEPQQVAGLASTRTYPLNSSFVPTSNMAVNLVASVGRSRASEVLESSFAQFQADRSVVGVARAIKRNEEGLEGYLDAMHCHLGDFTEYAGLRRELSDLEKAAAKARSASRRAAASVSLSELNRGDIIKIPSGRREGFGVVLEESGGGRRHSAAPMILTGEAQVRRLTDSDLDGPLSAIGRIVIPKQFSPRNPKAKRDLAATLRIKGAQLDRPTPAPLFDQEEHDGRVELLRARIRSHPCHDCPYREQHARWAERYWKLQRETEGLQRKVDSRTHSVARTFDRLCDLLAELGYLTHDGTKVTDQGRTLQQLYSERDLLVAECLRQDVWRRLDPASFASVISALVYQARHEAETEVRIPNSAVEEGLSSLMDIWDGVAAAQRRHRLPPMTAPDPGMTWIVHRWAGGNRLEVVLRDSDLSAGDFVRRCKQLVDLLDQIADASADETIRRTARKAIDLVMRGVVAADRLD